MKVKTLLIILAVLLLPSLSIAAQNIGGLPALTVSNDGGGGQTYSVTLQILMIMTVLTFIPAIVIMMTSFTRIVIVLAILRQAMGMPQVPTNMILVGLALFLSLFVMTPVFEKAYQDGISPYMDKKINAEQAFKKAASPFKAFMLEQTRVSDLNLFAKMAKKKFKHYSDAPLTVIIPAFITSELKTAFQIGFLLFIPFLIIDMVVASVLMAMGMMMLSPLIVSLPFKIMLFVMVDGWGMVMGTLGGSFGL